MANKKLIDAAVEWGKAGIPVFPCNSSKAPLTENGFYDAVSSPNEVRELFMKYGDKVKMIGGRMGDGLFAVDVDLYKSKEVQAWYKARLEDGSLTPTRVHETARGGLHLLYEADTSPTCVPVSGVEVKGDGGYIILPGTPGYEVKSEGIAKAPANLMELLNRAVSANKGSTIAQLESNILSGADFHNSLTQLGAKLASSGASLTEIQKHLLDIMKASTAASAGHERHSRWRMIMSDAKKELSNIVASAYRKFNDQAVMEEAGELLMASGEGGIFEEVEGVFATPPDIINEPQGKNYNEDKWPFTGEGYFADEEIDLRDIRFNLYPIYTQNETVVLFAEPKTGKTAVAVTTAMHIACGMDLGALKVKEQGACVYYALEGSHAIRLRVQSWIKTMRERGVKLPERIPMFVVEKPSNFLKEEVRKSSANQLISAHKYAEKAGTPLKVIFIDTLTKAMPGGDQNSVEDTASLFELVSLCRAGGVTATIVFVHHKSRQGHLRGSSNIEAEPDMLLDVSKKGEIINLKIARARSIEDGATYHFAISSVDLGETHEGHPLKGMMVDPMEHHEGDMGDVDYAEVQRLAQRREALTQLGESPDAKKVIDAWFLKGLIEGKAVRGTVVAPSATSAIAKEALATVANDAGGTVYGDYIIRPRYNGNDVVGFNVGKASF